MKLQDAIKNRIPRVRLSKWSNPNAYLRLPLLKDGTYGPWMELYDDLTQETVLNIRPGSQKILAIGPIMTDDDQFEAYTGPISEHEKDVDNFARSYEEQ